MNSQDLLLLNLIGAGAFVAWYAVSRGGGRRPTRLHFHVGEPSHQWGKISRPSVIEKKPTHKAQEVAPKKSSYDQDLSNLKSQSNSQSNSQVKSLNVLFMYNAHSWDAYEVLGVPAGSSLKSVTEAYQNILRSCDKNSINFHEAAYQAILKKQN